MQPSKDYYHLNDGRITPQSELTNNSMIEIIAESHIFNMTQYYGKNKIIERARTIESLDDSRIY